MCPIVYYFIKTIYFSHFEMERNAAILLVESGSYIIYTERVIGKVKS